jgi:ABC-type transporter Mla MlaB component
VFRVNKSEGCSHTTITVDGKVSHDCIEVIESFCDEQLSAGKPVHLFLRDVTTVDQAGRALLERLAAKGVRLRAQGIYNSFIVRELTHEKRSGMNQ